MCHKGIGTSSADQRPVTVGCRVHSVAIQTALFDESFHFYSRIIGLPVVREPFSFKARTLAWLSAGSALIELFSVKHGASPVDYDPAAVGITHIAFEVDDLDLVRENLLDRGVKVVKGPLLPPSGDPAQPRVLFVEDPDGAAVQFREPAREDGAGEHGGCVR